MLVLYATLLRNVKKKGGMKNERIHQLRDGYLLSVCRSSNICLASGGILMCIGPECKYYLPRINNPAYCLLKNDTVDKFPDCNDYERRRGE